MSVPKISLENADVTGIPANGFILGTGPYTKGFLLQIRNKHDAGVAKLSGHYKLVRGDAEYAVGHVPVGADIAKNIAIQLSSKTQRSFERVRAAILDTIGDAGNGALLDEHLFHPKYWCVVHK